jgi:hypothetical protein
VLTAPPPFRMRSFKATGSMTKAAMGNLKRQFCLELHWLSHLNHAREISSPLVAFPSTSVANTGEVRTTTHCVQFIPNGGVGPVDDPTSRWICGVNGNRSSLMVCLETKVLVSQSDYVVRGKCTSFLI